MEVKNLVSGREIQPRPPAKFFGVRHVQVALYFIMTLVSHSMRVNLFVGIVAMTDPATSPSPEIPTYNWTDKNVILSSFYWGYIIPQCFAGQISRIYGPKWFLAASMLVSSMTCMAIPVMAHHFGSKGVMACRILQGLAQGFQFPAIHHLLGQWAPTPERSRITTFIYSRTPLGIIIGMGMTGLISASWLGWPFSFYMFGSLGFGWVLIWVWYGADCPSEHKFISEQERSYIETTLGTKEKKKQPTPWGAIFSSLPFWAVIIGNLGSHWGYVTLLTQIPNYMNKVMGFNMRANSFLSAAPYLVFWIFCCVTGLVADHLINSGAMSRGAVRKLFNSLGTCIPAVILVWLSFIGDNQTGLSVTLLIGAVGISSTAYCGCHVNHIDLSPTYAGVLMGIINGTVNVFSIISPLIVQAVVYDETDKSLWRIIFIVTACIGVTSAIFYICFAKGETQYWNGGGSVDDNKKEEKEEEAIF